MKDSNFTNVLKELREKTGDQLQDFLLKAYFFSKINYKIEKDKAGMYIMIMEPYPDDIRENLADYMVEIFDLTGIMDEEHLLRHIAKNGLDFDRETYTESLNYGLEEE